MQTEIESNEYSSSKKNTLVVYDARSTRALLIEGLDYQVASGWSVVIHTYIQ